VISATLSISKPPFVVAQNTILARRATASAFFYRTVSIFRGLNLDGRNQLETGIFQQTIMPPADPSRLYS
jgi:hypothetical protein